MKKIMSVLTVLCICLLMPIRVGATGSAINTTVPTVHYVQIDAEHALALCPGVSNDESDIYEVPRFAEPEFKLKADVCWAIEKVLLNDEDVTEQVVDGTLKLSKVYTNMYITIETKENHRWSAWEPNGDGTHTRHCLDNCGKTETEVMQGNVDNDDDEDDEDTQEQGGGILGSITNTGDSSNIGLWIAVFLFSGGCLAVVYVYRKRKQDKNK